MKYLCLNYNKICILNSITDPFITIAYSKTATDKAFLKAQANETFVKVLLPEALGLAPSTTINVFPQTTMEQVKAIVCKKKRYGSY